MPQGPGTYGNKKGRPAKKKTKKSVLTGAQKKLPDFLKEKIVKSKMKKSK